ncbi:MAG: c-type cytochrome [Sphingomonadales bacterium]|nr:MAG: c-type cytochrome [Sphingomonadales bacterium]
MRWIVRGLMGLAGLAVLALIVVFGGSEWIIQKGRAAPLPPVAADRTPAGIAEGARLAKALGCRSCHGPEGQGRLLVDVPNVIHVAPPAFAPIVADYSDAELARLIRHGIKRDGTATFVMPVEGHAGLADQDLARIIGWMRTLKPSAADSKDGLHFGPLGRVALLTGGILPEVKPDTRAPALRPADSGAYLTDTVCAACHSLRETRKAHDDGRPVPPLAEIGPAYDLVAFKKLLRTGVGLSPRDLGLMRQVAKDDLAHLTDAEMDAIHAYLQGEAAKSPSK